MLVLVEFLQRRRNQIQGNGEVKQSFILLLLLIILTATEPKQVLLLTLFHRVIQGAVLAAADRRQTIIIQSWLAVDFLLLIGAGFEALIITANIRFGILTRIYVAVALFAHLFCLQFLHVLQLL